jgi:hypothetical protein
MGIKRADDTVRVSGDNKVFAGEKVIGYIEDGVFIQRITDKHILRLKNSKGLDVAVYRHLKSRCHTWMVMHRFTQEIWTMPFAHIEEVGELFDMHKGYGPQYQVSLEHFNVAQPALQKRLFG